MRKNIREQLETETAKKLADYLASLTEKDIIDCYFLDNDTFTIRFSLYGNESVVNNIIEIIHDNDLVDFFARIWLDEGTFHYIFDYEYDTYVLTRTNVALQGENGYLDENIGTWKQHLDELSRNALIKFQTAKFSSANDMLEKIKVNDYYNHITEEYVFTYNDRDSIAVYNIDKDEAKTLSKQAKENDEYWGAFLGPGGYIYDEPQNSEWCESHFKEDGWITTTDYQNAILCK